MYLLGCNFFAHDSSAALLDDGHLVCAVEEERLTRRKHTDAFPQQAITSCLAAAGIALGDVAHVAFGCDPRLARRRALTVGARHLPEVLRQSMRKRPRQPRDGGNPVTRPLHNLTRRRFFAEHLAAVPGEHRYRLHFVPHHLAHAASAYFASPYEEAAVLTIDGTGELDCVWMGVGRGNRLAALQQGFYPHSIGMVYSAVTGYLGFALHGHEGKVMGLAPYGQPRFDEAFRRIVELRPNGEVHIDQRYFTFLNPWLRTTGAVVSDAFVRELGPPRAPGAPIEERHADIAASLQARLEDYLLHAARHLLRATGLRRLCYAGGVALNCVANRRLFEETELEDGFLQPAAGDSGTALGAALYLAHQRLDLPRGDGVTDACQGPSFGDEQILAVLQRHSDVLYTQPESIEETCAQLLAERKILGWFQGRMEMGPRALGCRSILADPRDPDMKDALNLRVKHREAFRPFAPSVLEEEFAAYFEHGRPSPFMLVAAMVRPEKRRLIPAVTHVDGSARVQVVPRRMNPRYYRMIEAFAEITGIPLVLNTSLNVRGEPIACTPEDALACLLTTEMDCLAMGSFLVWKFGTPAPLDPWREVRAGARAEATGGLV